MNASSRGAAVRGLGWLRVHRGAVLSLAAAAGVFAIVLGLPLRSTDLARGDEIVQAFPYFIPGGRTIAAPPTALPLATPRATTPETDGSAFRLEFPLYRS